MVTIDNYQYEIECMCFNYLDCLKQSLYLYPVSNSSTGGFNINGGNIGVPPGYSGPNAISLDTCVPQCDYWNDHPSLGSTCLVALWVESLNGCYIKSAVGNNGAKTSASGYNFARLLTTGYLTPTDGVPYAAATTTSG